MINFPLDQEPILTSGVKQFFTHVKAVQDPRRRPSMGIVHGPVGVGKTMAIRAYLGQLESSSHRELREVIAVTTKPGPTPKSMALDIVTMLGSVARGRSAREIADIAIEKLQSNDIKILIIDEAERLGKNSIELLRYISDSAQCSVVLVGLPQLVQAANRSGWLASLYLDFPPVEREEMLSLVLPSLVFPCWQFDLDSEADLEMGEHIYDIVGPHLRKLRHLLQASSYVAQLEGAPRIKFEMISKSLEFILGEKYKG